jgi:hypothetical protein
VFGVETTSDLFLSFVVVRLALFSSLDVYSLVRNVDRFFTTPFILFLSSFARHIYVVHTHINHMTVDPTPYLRNAKTILFF